MTRSLQLAQNATFERIVKALMAQEAEIGRAKKQLKNRDPSLGLELLDYQKSRIDRKTQVVKHTVSLLKSVEPICTK